MNVQALSGATHSIVSDVNLSAGAGTHLNAKPAVQYVTYSVPVSELKRGIFQRAINGVNQKSPQDEYSPTVTYGMRDFGTVTLSSGNQAFKFSVTGKNAGSSNYNLVFDYIELVP